MTTPRTTLPTHVAPSDFCCVSRSARGISAATIAANGRQPVEPVVEHGERSGPAEALNADDRNQIAREHLPCVRPSSQSFPEASPSRQIN